MYKMESKNIKMYYYEDQEVFDKKELTKRSLRDEICKNCVHHIFVRRYKNYFCDYHKSQYYEIETDKNFSCSDFYKCDEKVILKYDYKE